MENEEVIDDAYQKEAETIVYTNEKQEEVLKSSSCPQHIAATKLNPESKTENSTKERCLLESELESWNTNSSTTKNVDLSTKLEASSTNIDSAKTTLQQLYNRNTSTVQLQQHCNQQHTVHNGCSNENTNDILLAVSSCLSPTHADNLHSYKMTFNEKKTTFKKIIYSKHFEASKEEPQTTHLPCENRHCIDGSCMEGSLSFSSSYPLSISSNENSQSCQTFCNGSINNEKNNNNNISDYFNINKGNNENNHNASESLEVYHSGMNDYEMLQKYRYKCINNNFNNKKNYNHNINNNFKNEEKTYENRESIKKRRRRILFSKKITDQLENKFEKQKYLSTTEREKLATSLNLTTNQVTDLCYLSYHNSI